MHAITAISLVFGGCCSNVICLELIVTEHPGSVNIITFAQFLFIAMEGFVFSAKFGTKTPAIPLAVHGKLTMLYLISVLFQVMLLHLHVDIPLQQLLRSGTLIANLILGVVLLKRSYRFTKYLSVVMICIGIGVSTLASSYHQWTYAHSQSSKSQQESEHHYGPKQFFSWLLGIFLLLLALITSGLLGIYQEWMFNKYGKHATESLYYSHLLPLPLFFFLAKDIHRHAQMYNTSEPFLEGLLDIPKMWIYLAINVLSNYACISGVFLLSAECTSLTVNLILTLRKFSSLLFSVIYFDNAFTLFHWVGTILVFGGTLLFVDVADLFRKQPLLSSDVALGNVSSTSESNHDQNGFIADENKEEFLSLSSSNISNDTTCVRRIGASSSSISNSSANGNLSANFNSSANVNSLANGATDLKMISATSSESTVSHAKSYNLNTVSTTHPDFTSFTSGISNTVSNRDNSNDLVSSDSINIYSTECNNTIESTLENNSRIETGKENILYSSPTEMTLKQRKVNVSQADDISHEKILTNTKDSPLFGRIRQYFNENISSVRQRDNAGRNETKGCELKPSENRKYDANITESQDIVVDEQGCTSNNNSSKLSTGLGVFDKFKSVFERKETGASSGKDIRASIDKSSIKDDSNLPENFDTTSLKNTQTKGDFSAIQAMKYESGKALINTLENKEKLSSNEFSILNSKQSDLNLASNKAIDKSCKVKNESGASVDSNTKLGQNISMQSNDLNSSELENRISEANVNFGESTKVSVMGRILGAISKDPVTSPQCSNADEKLTKSSQFVFTKWFDDSVNKLDSKFNRMRRFSESFKDGKTEENTSNTSTMQYSTNGINRNIDRVHSVDASSGIAPENAALHACNNESISSEDVTSKKGVVTSEDPVKEELFSSSSLQSGAGFSSSSNDVVKPDDLNMKMVEQPKKEIVPVFETNDFKFNSVPENKIKSLRESSLNVKQHLTAEYTHKQKNSVRNSAKIDIEDENLVVRTSDLNSSDESSSLRASEGKIQNRKSYTSVAEKGIDRNKKIRQSR